MFPIKSTRAQFIWLITHKLDAKKLSLKKILNEKVGESGSQFANRSQFLWTVPNFGNAILLPPYNFPLSSILCCNRPILLKRDLRFMSA